MSKGTSIWLKCPKCKRGKFGHKPQVKGVRKTGRVEGKISRSAHRGTGDGGASFYGHRGEVECLDCGHKWYSTHPNSGRVAVRMSTGTKENES